MEGKNRLQNVIIIDNGYITKQHKWEIVKLLSKSTQTSMSKCSEHQNARLKYPATGAESQYLLQGDNRETEQKSGQLGAGKDEPILE